MARDPLQILLTVRQRTVEVARRELATCLMAETAAEAVIRSIDEMAQRDRSAHNTLQDALYFLDLFARRAAVNEAQRGAAQSALAAAQARTAEARAAVAEARTAAEAVATLIAERAAAAAIEAARHEQHALDDIARARFGSANRNPAMR